MISSSLPPFSPALFFMGAIQERINLEVILKSLANLQFERSTIRCAIICTQLLYRVGYDTDYIPYKQARAGL
jgi:hypothetical protein